MLLTIFEIDIKIFKKVNRDQFPHVCMLVDWQPKCFHIYFQQKLTCIFLFHQTPSGKEEF